MYVFRLGYIITLSYPKLVCSLIFILPVGFNSPKSSEISSMYKYGPHCMIKIKIVNMSLGTPYMRTGNGDIVPPISSSALD
jgi:hypothetical protein